MEARVKEQMEPETDYEAREQSNGRGAYGAVLRGKARNDHLYCQYLSGIVH